MIPPPIDRSMSGIVSGWDVLDFERGVSAGWNAPDRLNTADLWPATYKAGWVVGWQARERAEAEMEAACARVQEGSTTGG